MSDCSVCTEPFTNSVRTKVSCGYCDYSACKSCVTRYLLSQVVDAHCMNCRTGWNHEFMVLNLTKAFCTGPWRDHKKNMLMNREKALLPNFQVYAAAKKRMTELEPIQTKLFTELNHANKVTMELRNDMSNKHSKLISADPENEIKLLEEQKKLLDKYSEEYMKYTLLSMKYGRIHSEFNVHYYMYSGYNEKKETEKKEFIMKCVKEGCRGFLSSAYKCELCNTYVCKDCMIEKNEKNDETHVCKTEDVESVSLIRKQTKPCPKCGIRISKIDGCDQMWCTADKCGTAFSWNSGKIISGVIHNPHYYEWQRRNNNGVVPRNPGDNPCGGFPDYMTLTALFRTLGLTISLPKACNKDVNLMYAMHRCFMDIENVRIPNYRQERDPMLFKDVHISYLIGETTEKQWSQSIFMKEHNIEKRAAVCEVLNTFLNAGTDIFRNIMNELNKLQAKKQANIKYVLTIEDFEPVSKYIEQLEQLRSYINECLLKTGELKATPVPQIDKMWMWIPVSSADKIKLRLNENKHLNNTVETKVNE